MAQQWPPKRATAFTVVFPIRDGTGAPVTGVAGLDSERSIDGAAFADCTNEATEIGTTGFYSLTLSTTDMDGDYITVQVKSTSYPTVGFFISTVGSTWDELDNLVDNLESRLGTPSDLGSGATVAANLADIEAQTDDIGAAGAGLTAVPWNASWDAEVQSEVDDAIKALHMDHLVVAQGTVETSGSNSAFQVQTTLAEATNDHYNHMAILFVSGAEAGQARLINDYVGATGVVSWLDALTGTPADASEFIILPAHVVPLKTATQASIDAIEADTNELQTDDYPTSIAAIQADTDDIQTRLPAALVGGRMDSDVGNMQAGTVTAAVVATGAIDADATAADFLAEINAEVVDALATDTLTLPGQSAPPLAPTHREAIAWLYKVLRNRVAQTSTQWSLYADNETTVDTKATVSDDGTTAIRQELVSGP